MKRNALAWAAIVLSTAALISSQGLTRRVPAALQISPEGQKQVRALGEAFNAVAEYVKPSVVQISVTRSARVGGMQGPRRNGAPDGNGQAIPKELEEMLKRFRDFGGQIEPQQFGEGSGRGLSGTGSGFVYDDKGHIVTNNHVVEGAGEIKVTFYDGEEAVAKVVGTDPKADVAVIKVDLTNYRPLQKGKSANSKVGDWVLAVGSPFGFDQPVTSGIISAVGRNDAGILGAGAYEDFLQTDAAINPGNSGGPLVDLDGRVIGINSAIATSSRSSSGVGFAIPLDMAANLADRLIKDGKVTRAQLGILLDRLTPVVARKLGCDPKTKGVVAMEVVEGSPAADAGVQQFDVVTNFNGTPVSNVQAFRNLVSTSEIGKEFALTVLREGSEKALKVKLAPAEVVMAKAGNRGDRPRRPEAREPEAAPTTAVEGFGIEVQDLTPELAKQFGYPASAKGLIISDVKEGSPADAAGLEDGMLITKIAQDKKLGAITSAKQFQELAGKSDDLLLYVQNKEGLGKLFTLAKPSK